MRQGWIVHRLADLSECGVNGWFEWVWGDWLIWMGVRWLADLNGCEVTLFYMCHEWIVHRLADLSGCEMFGWFECDVIGWFEWVWGDILWWSLIRKWACTVLHSVCFLCCSLALCTDPGLHCVYFLCFTLCVLCVQKLAKLVEEEKLREEAGFYDFSSEDEAEKELEAQLAKYVRLSGYLPSTVIGPAGAPLPPPPILKPYHTFCFMSPNTCFLFKCPAEASVLLDVFCCCFSPYDLSLPATLFYVLLNFFLLLSLPSFIHQFSCCPYASSLWLSIFRCTPSTAWNWSLALTCWV